MVISEWAGFVDLETVVRSHGWAIFFIHFPYACLSTCFVDLQG